MVNRWHQDVNPCNILVVSAGASSPYQYTFKLADLGISHFQTSDDGKETLDYDSFGTQTYGKPAFDW